VQVSSLYTADGTHLKNDHDVAESFNQYFASVFPKDNFSCFTTPTMMTVDDTEPRCADLYLDVNIIIKAISRLKPDKAQGPDDFSPKLLIETCNVIAYPLYLLFRKSLDESSVPNDWKQANVKPIF